MKFFKLIYTTMLKFYKYNMKITKLRSTQTRMYAFFPPKIYTPRLMQSIKSWSKDPRDIRGNVIINQSILPNYLTNRVATMQSAGVQLTLSSKSTIVQFGQPSNRCSGRNVGYYFGNYLAHIRYVQVAMQITITYVLPWCV